MNGTTAGDRGILAARLFLWIARLVATFLVVVLVLFASDGGVPGDLHEWAYIVFFPIGFSVAYLLGWRWPVLAGWGSLSCMVLSLIVIGRVYEPRMYLTWAVLCLPGVVYLLAGLKLRAARAAAPADAGAPG